MTELTELTIRRPDDFHVHLRDGAMLAAVLPFTAGPFGRALVMPNLAPPVTTAEMADRYRNWILAALPHDLAFTPLMTLYLTDATDPDVLERGYHQASYLAAKLYPAHATTNSAAGVTGIDRITSVLERMAAIGMVLSIHGEVTDPDVDVFDREAVFIDRVLIPLRRRLPELRIVLEHITTEDAASYVAQSEPGIAATITPHHLIWNRNAIFAGGIRPHAYCLPIAKREKHRQALRRAAASGNDRFFLGTDTAPHTVAAKQSDCGCAGIFSAPVALETYLQVFEELGALDKIEAFASENGARFYGLPLNNGRITLRREDRPVPNELAPETGGIRPFLAGETLRWRIAGYGSL